MLHFKNNKKMLFLESAKLFLNFIYFVYKIKLNIYDINK